MWSTWLEAEESCHAIKFARKAISQGTRETLCLAKRKSVLPNYLPILYIPSLPMKHKECFQRENPSKNTWELEIFIPTIIYTFSLGFPLHLPLHLYILERFLTQTLTLPNLSVEWLESCFGAFGKHWKESLSGGCNWAKLWDLES